jgi:hypothetical protein
VRSGLGRGSTKDGQPNMTRLKAMSMYEQVETIEQSTQEALRAQEDNQSGIDYRGTKKRVDLARRGVENH